MTNHDEDADVAIVGMGPTGAALASILGRQGISTVVLEKLPDLYPLPRAVGLDHEVMRLLQEFGIADSMSPFTMPYRASEYRGVDGQVIKRLDSPPPPYRTGWHPMYVFDQPAFEKLLRQHVHEQASVDVRLECTVVDVEQDSDTVTIRYTRPDSDDIRTLDARYLIACDGATSFVRTSLGIGLTDLGFHENYLVVDAVVGEQALEKLPETQVQFCEPARPATYVVLANQHRRWEIMLDPGELPLGPVSDDDVWPYLERWIKPGEARIWRSAAYIFHGLVAETWRVDRIFLAGDAAHMTPPFMAQGMAQGVRDAQNLGWKLGRALRRNPSADELLDTYQWERRPHVVEMTGHTIDLGRVICERDEASARVRDAQYRGHADGDVPVTYRSNFMPALSAGLVTPASAGAGQIMPQPLVEGPEGPVLLDDIAGRGFRLVVSAKVDEVTLTRLADVLDRIDGHVIRIYTSEADMPDDRRAFRERDNLLTDWLTGVGATMAIVRPDHYVYGSASTLESMRDHLETLAACVDGPARSLTC